MFVPHYCAAENICLSSHIIPSYISNTLYIDIVYAEGNRNIQWLCRATFFCTHFVWWWFCVLNWWETTGSYRRAETLTTGTSMQTQWQTLWWHLLLLRESTSALNKACNHAVVTREQTKQCRRTHILTYSLFTNVCFCLSDFSLSAILH